MRSTIPGIFILLFISNFTFGQKDTSARNSVFLELGGAGGHYSINYERAIPIYNNFGAHVALGISPSLINNSNFSPRLPFQLNLYIKKSNHIFELGAALTPYIGDYLLNDSFSENFRRRDYAIFGQIGYRYTIKDKFYAGIAFTPVLFDLLLTTLQQGSYYLYNNFSPWGALRIGYKF